LELARYEKGRMLVPVKAARNFAAADTVKTAFGLGSGY